MGVMYAWGLCVVHCVVSDILCAVVLYVGLGVVLAPFTDEMVYMHVGGCVYMHGSGVTCVEVMLWLHHGGS